MRMGWATAASIVLLAGAASATATWPDCMEHAEYTGGFDFVAGYRQAHAKMTSAKCLHSLSKNVIHLPL